jgi:hypothetical protein
MARTTIALVTDILDDTTLEDDVLQSFIDAANTFVTAALGGEGLSVALLTEIERWVAAHMVSHTRERQIKKAGAGGAEVEYTGFWGKGLNGTSYGQMAVMLDTSKTLEAMAQGKLAAWSKAVSTENIYD